MSMPLAHYLKDFSAVQTARFQPEALAFDLDPVDFPGMPLLELPQPQPEPVDVEAERGAAYDRGAADMRAQLESRHAEALAALVARHAEEIEALAEAHRNSMADGLVRALETITASLSAHVSNQVIETLAPFLSETIREKALADLAGLLRQSLEDGGAATVTVHGPAALFARLRDLLPEATERLVHVEARDLDLSVTVGDAALVTRLSAWTASLKKVMA